MKLLWQLALRKESKWLTHLIMLIFLPSVASYIDMTDAVVYAAYQEGGYDDESGQHVSDCSQEWKQTLSPEDAETVDIIDRYLQLQFKKMLIP